MRFGAAGATRDAFLYANPWGFDLRDIRLQVHLWHGEKDEIIPLAMAQYMAAMIPNCRATFYKEEGHFSLVVKYMEETLSVLAA
jgi:pimeloyl-ACP methyl ester carboxylesterase